MRPRPSLAIGVLLVTMLGGTPAALGQAPMPPPAVSPPSITVLGSGSVTHSPDVAELTAGVLTQAAAAAQALAQNTVSMEKVLKVATDAGIAERDIQTRGINVVPQRRPGRPDTPQPPEIVGYEVTNEVRMKVRDLSMVGRLLDQLVGQGANVLGGIRFFVDDPAPLLDQARAKALADARRKAELYANAAGVKLGRVLSIQESGASIPQPRFVTAPMMAAASAAVPVAPGEQDFQASVTVVYAIE